MRTRLPRRRSLHHRCLHARRLCRRRRRPLRHLQRRLRLQDHPRSGLLPRRRRPCPPSRHRHRHRRCLRNRRRDLTEHEASIGSVDLQIGGWVPPRFAQRPLTATETVSSPAPRLASAAGARAASEARSRFRPTPSSFHLVAGTRMCICVHKPHVTPRHATPRRPPSHLSHAGGSDLA